jgi:hypothetical protein
VANDGYCSLREAIKAANDDKASGSRLGECPAGSGINELITVSAKTYVLTLGPLEILDSLFLNGEGPKSTIIDGNNNSRVFSISQSSEPPKNPTVSISSVSIQNGMIHEGGAGIYIAKGTHLNLINSIVRNNEAISLGGGIMNEGSLLIIDSTIQNNKISLSGGGGQQFTGGGIVNTGILKIDGSTISGNEATRGAGISNGTPFLSRRGGRVEITNSTISGNKASTQGGGIANYGGTMSIRFSTITENEANTELKVGGEFRGGDGIYNSDTSTPNLGRGEPGIVFVENTIIAGNDDSNEGRRTIGRTLLESGPSHLKSGEDLGTNSA